MSSTVSVQVSDRIATITFNSPKTLNAITRPDYDAFARALREVDKREDVLVTIWQANGKWFSAGTSVTGTADASKKLTTRDAFTSTIAPVNTDVSNALYTHSKILVAALNGPVMGIAAAFLGHFDFIYALPSAWLSVPFTFLGIISEAGSSVTFRNRMGAAKANEVLIWGKKKDAKELLECGFINGILPEQPVPEFQAAVRKLVLAELEGLDPTALLGVKKLIKAGLNDQHNLDAVNLRESYAQSERLASGVPGERFAKIAKKELKHKL
ncbi:ClpP/crotonase [Trametes coccinea BRFM310]|uniref:ClpP/crotonase n=1 Tax=Trametes coccinea (strain BRFM310) TaxID=1353009 RepID=A0A1Y2IKE4_TRAC3|nr:ClpP/crotonase [Trametes coccinea BRFM310]